MAFRIGHHPNNLHLRLASLWPGAFASFKPEFVSYVEGRETADRLRNGEFDIGGTGSTPPILAAASGLSVAYAAASAPRPANGAILVSKTSGIDTIADLKAKPIALVDGSFLTYFLAKRLEEAGLRLTDVERKDISPLQSREALQDGTVTAWIAMAPHLEQSLASGEFRVLAHCGDLIPNRSVFWTIKDRGLSAETLKDFAGELQRLGQDITADPEKASALLSVNGDDTERRAWTRIVSERNWQAIAADTSLLREQQAEADTLLAHGDLGIRLTIDTKNGKEI
ncbi:PhnD/SsuA/transferrin family substrate-binding protein [Agrobacterium sp. rho-13.3]|uniref:PhnD/SsuA/transferrin family substrate-binding protein n=1 Tax=Agrobacterium sp. rho-13.3 TaxID=3072980 RepID=UPI002A0B2398|nr:ABC transporter substrate-binding protein [Agrobacterium sp. rho-13.3]MDX8306753.1 ABC transporter substrate-binding protein [Agrobacterium sp. rho-13.3]MDX8306916.1 ABC transporter substrate-binding protein [Agrobacterium sp. rho-13.3]